MQQLSDYLLCQRPTRLPNRDRVPDAATCGLASAALLVLVLLIGASLGLLVRSARLQREAVAAITRAGGSVVYQQSWIDKALAAGAKKPGAARWLADQLGIDFYTRVIYASGSPHAGDAELTHIGRLTSLQRLWLAGSECTDSGLANLQSLSQLETLDLGSTKITNAGLAHLSGLTGLSELDLSHTGITGKGLAHLDRMKHLHILNLEGCQIDDAGLASLAVLTNLEGLTLSGCLIGNEGLATSPACRSCKS